MILARLKARGLPILVVGGVNTALGYGVTVGLYSLLPLTLTLLPIAALANIICITISFLTDRTFIFKGRGAWLPQYLRCYIIYGGSALYGMAGLWLLVTGMSLPVWLAQGLVMGRGVVISFVGQNGILLSHVWVPPVTSAVKARGCPYLDVSGAPY